MIRFLLINGLVILFGQSFSQRMSILSVTKQNWSGGICCRTGTNYNIQIKLFDQKKEIKLDSLWMEGYCVDVSKYSDSITFGGDYSIINIYEGWVLDDGMPVYNWCYDPTKKGVELSYYRKGRKKRLVVTKCIKELEPANYP